MALPQRAQPTWPCCWLPLASLTSTSLAWSMLSWRRLLPRFTAIEMRLILNMAQQFKCLTLPATQTEMAMRLILHRLKLKLAMTVALLPTPALSIKRSTETRLPARQLTPTTTKRRRTTLGAEPLLVKAQQPTRFTSSLTAHRSSTHSTADQATLLPT